MGALQRSSVPAPLQTILPPVLADDGLAAGATGGVCSALHVGYEQEPGPAALGGDCGNVHVGGVQTRSGDEDSGDSLTSLPYTTACCYDILLHLHIQVTR